MDATCGTDGIKKFIAAYNSEYGHDPENAFAALGYDAMYLLADAIKRAGSTDAQAIKKAIEATKNFPGITGAITFSADAHVPQKGVTIIAVKGGKFTLGAEVVPDKVPIGSDQEFPRYHRCHYVLGRRACAAKRRDDHRGQRR